MRGLFAPSPVLILALTLPANLWLFPSSDTRTLFVVVRVPDFFSSCARLPLLNEMRFG